MLTHIRSTHLVLFILYMFVLTCATFAIGYLTGIHTSTHAIASTITLTVGW